MALSPHGNLLAAASLHGKIQVFNRKKKWKLQKSWSCKDVITEVEFTHDGNWLVTVGSNGRLHMISLKSGDLISTPQLTCELSKLVPWGNENNFMITGNDGSIHFWTAGEKASSRKVTVKGCTLTGIGFTPGNEMLAATMDGNRIALLDPTSGKVLQVVTPELKGLLDAGLSQSGCALAYVTEDGTIALYRMPETLKEVTDFDPLKYYHRWKEEHKVETHKEKE